jgi:ATP-binding cassette, subfamily C, bacterial LapB
LKPSALLVSALHEILQFYFGNTQRETILSLAGCSEENFGLNELMQVSKQTNLYAQSTEVDIDTLDNFLLPVIVYDKDENLLVIKSMGMTEVNVYNPLKDTEEKVPKNTMKNYTRGVLFFRDEKKKFLSSRTKELSWFYQPLKASWRAYAEVAVLSFFINFFALALPLFTMNIYDRVIPNFATQTLVVLAGGVLIIFAFEMIFKSARVYILENTGKKIGSYLENLLLERILGVQTQYDHLLSGAKANLFKELQQIKEFFTSRTMVQMLDLPFFFIAIIVIYMISPLIALVPFIVGVIMVAFNLLMQIPLANMAHEQFKEAQNKHGFLVETIQGRDSVKLVNGLEQRMFIWRRLVAFHEHLGQKMQVIQHATSNSSYILIQGVTLFVVYLGVYQVHDKVLSIGGLIAVTILSSRAMVPIVNISSVLLQYKKMKEALESINAYWHLPREVNENTHIGLGKLRGKIEFKDVEYFYQGSKYPSLSKINITINPGEKVGIIGQTGAGKSTILRLIAALDLPTTGSLYLDGHETSTLHPTEVRQNIGVMPQDPFMFAASIKENISLSRSISKDELVKLIELTGLSELIKKSGQGDNLNVGENGDNLSVGQKHLVALARALVHDPSILILDEPTTGLDVGLERTVVERLKEIVKDKTLLVITHRFAALDLVDRVIVIEDGRVVADGEKSVILAKLQGGK